MWSLGDLIEAHKVLDFKDHVEQVQQAELSRNAR
jgi:hypothetical protein